MKKMILKVQDKTKVPSISNYANVIYISKFMNTIGIEIKEKDLSKLEEDSNIISYRESEEGTFQVTPAI